MKKYSTFFLFVSFIFLIINGSSLGFIVYQESLGDYYGDLLFSGTSLFGALCASIADEKKFAYYSNLFFISHLIVLFLPFYYWSIAILI